MQAPNEKPRPTGGNGGSGAALGNSNSAGIVPLKVVVENIPEELRTRRQWVVWRLMVRNGKPSKVPFEAATGKFAKSNDSATWCGFDQAVSASRTQRFDGIGFVFAEGDGLFGIDLDHVLDPATGLVEPWAAEVVEKFRGTYIERSPSGTGIRIFCKGRPIRCGKGTLEKRIEVYDHTSPRYLTVTGVPL